MVITIARQYGSGGRAIGRALAETLKIPFYDKELINIAARESSVSPEIFEKYDEKASNSLLYALSMGAAATIDSEYGMSPMVSMNDRIYMIQHDVIKKLAEDTCVIVGRCADHVLADRKDCIKLFIYADIEKRIKYAVDVHKVPKEKARSVINKVDKTRANYYNYYSDSKWGDPNNYNLCINSGELGVSKCVDLIVYYLRMRGVV